VKPRKFAAPCAARPLPSQRSAPALVRAFCRQPRRRLSGALRQARARAPSLPIFLRSSPPGLQGAKYLDASRGAIGSAAPYRFAAWRGPDSATMLIIALLISRATALDSG